MNRIRYVVVSFLVAMVAGTGLFYVQWLQPLQNWYDDAYWVWSEASPPEHSVIISIDQKALQMLRDEPMVFWGEHYATVIQALRRAEVSVIGLDVLFLVSIESWLEKIGLGGEAASRGYDIALRQQLAAGGVVLIGTAVFDMNGREEVMLPMPDYLFSLPGMTNDIGLNNLYYDPDGIIRHYLDAIPGKNGESLGPTFAAVLAERVGERGDGKAGIGRISFNGPPGTFQRIPFSEILSANGVDETLYGSIKGKVAIVAVEDMISQDMHLTPYATGNLFGHGELMPGAELHANIIETMLNGNAPKPIGLKWSICFLAVILFLSSALFARIHPVVGITACLGFAAISTAVGFVVFTKGYFFPVAIMQAAVMISYLSTLGQRLTGEERGRAQIINAFGRYVSDSVVEDLVAKDGKPDLRGEMRTVTVLFSDIRNFTTISEQLDAREVTEMLNAYLTDACEAILEQGGMVDKFIGDAVMAVFGAPAHQEDHALRAIHAALNMQKVASRFQSWLKERFPDRELPSFAIGVGMHTGKAVVGNIGSAKRMEFTVIGDTVNTASRLEGQTKVLGWDIVASRKTMETAGIATVEQAELLHVKGRQEPIEAVRVTERCIEEGKE